MSKKKLDEVRAAKAQEPIERQVAKIEAEVTAKVAAESVESVNIEGWGTFYRRDDGWHGPGGFYGPGTPMAKQCEEKSQRMKGNNKMFTSVQDAIGTLDKKDVSPEVYRLACEYLVNHREELRQRVFICLPGGLQGNQDGAWDVVKAGSQERCSCGNERVIVPLNPRSEFRPADKQLVVSKDNPVCLKPTGGDKSSTFVLLEIKEGAITFLEDPFAPFVLTLDIFSTKGYMLKELADVMANESKPPVFMRSFNGVPTSTPIFAINAIDVTNGTATITPDVDVEWFDPDTLSDHVCS